MPSDNCARIISATVRSQPSDYRLERTVTGHHFDWALLDHSGPWAGYATSNEEPAVIGPMTVPGPGGP